jgi:hypothetical protein
MKNTVIAIMAGALWLTTASFAQAPAATPAPAATNARCPRLDNDGKCPYGRTPGQGRAMMGRGFGRRGMMATRGGMGRGGPGPCMRMMNSPANPQPQAAPKGDTK